MAQVPAECEEIFPNAGIFVESFAGKIFFGSMKQGIVGAVAIKLFVLSRFPCSFEMYGSSADKNNKTTARQQTLLFE